MAGVIVISINKGIINAKMELQKLAPTELSLLSTQLTILNNRIINEIERVTSR